MSPEPFRPNVKIRLLHPDEGNACTEDLWGRYDEALQSHVMSSVLDWLQAAANRPISEKGRPVVLVIEVR